MKKITIVALLISIALFYSGCKKRNVVEFDMNYTTDFEIAAGTATAGVNYYYSSFNTNIASYFDQNKVNSNIVGEITCRFFEAKVKGPSSVKMNVMKNYEFFLDAGQQKEVRITHCSPWLDDMANSNGTQSIMSSSLTLCQLYTITYSGTYSSGNLGINITGDAGTATYSVPFATNLSTTMDNLITAINNANSKLVASKVSGTAIAVKAKYPSIKFQIPSTVSGSSGTFTSVLTTPFSSHMKIDGESCDSGSDVPFITECPTADRKYSNNLKNYFIEPSIRMKMKVYPHTTVPTTYTITATFQVHVKGIE